MPPGDGDLILKQVVAVIDSRTTVVCLHAAGQIQPVDQPYDTLAGQFQTPPFHVHCRSHSVPWMSGFVSTIRQDANHELLTRPLKQRRIGPNGEIGGRVPPPPKNPPPRLGPTLDSPKGPLSGSGVSLPGRSAALTDVPPGRVKDWVDSLPERFEVTSNGGGISETYWVKDLDTGERWVLKRGQYQAESVNEIVSTRLASEVGLPGRAVIGEVGEDGNGWVFLQHAEDVMPGYKVEGTAGGHSSIPKLLDRLEDRRDPIRALLVDFVTDEADAKGGNTLLLSRDGGRTIRIVPIDRSLSLMGWRNAIEPGKSAIVPGDWSLAGRLKVTDLRSYMKTRGSPKGLLELVQRIGDTAEGKRLIRDTYDEMIDSLEALDLEVLTEGLDQPPGHLQEIRSLLQQRIRTLRRNRDTILRQMGG